MSVELEPGFPHPGQTGLRTGRLHSPLKDGMKSLPMESIRRFRETLAQVFRTGFGLTRDEQKAILIVLAMFILGLAVYAWREWAAR